METIILNQSLKFVLKSGLLGGQSVGGMKAGFSLLQTRSHFSSSVMVAVGVSVLGVTELHFVNPGVKINGK